MHFIYIYDICILYIKHNVYLLFTFIHSYLNVEIFKVYNTYSHFTSFILAQVRQRWITLLAQLSPCFIDDKEHFPRYSRTGCVDFGLHISTAILLHKGKSYLCVLCSDLSIVFSVQNVYESIETCHYTEIV